MEVRVKRNNTTGGSLLYRPLAERNDALEVHKERKTS